jgi:hypothetical protein
MKLAGLLFWGYVDIDGKTHVLKYTTDRVIENYEKMPYVKGIFGPFEAFDFQHARELVSARWEKENN